MSILDTLAWIDAPRNAVANAAYEGFVNPYGDPLEGFWKGLSRQQERSFGDVLGVEAGKPTDDWGTWLTNNAIRLGLDVAGDPLNLLFGTGAIAKQLRLANEGGSAVSRVLSHTGVSPIIGKAWAESPLFQLFGHNLTRGIKTGEATSDDVIDAVTRMQREGGVTDLQDAARKAYEIYNPMVEQGASPLSVYTGLEKRSLGEAGQGLNEALNPIFQSLEKNAQYLSDVAPGYGFNNISPGLMDTAEMAYVPHVQTRASQMRQSGSRLGDVRYQADVELPSRQIMKWTDAEGNVTIGKLTHKDTGISTDTLPTGETVYFKGDIPVQMSKPTLEEVASAFPNLEWVQDPIAASYSTAVARQNMTNFVKLMGEMVDQGHLVKLRELPEGLKGWRQVKLPGFDMYAAPTWEANYLENLGSGYFKGQPLGRNWAEDFATNMADTSLGRGLTQANQWWRRNVLPFPGWLFGNLGSNTFGLQQSGVNPKWMSGVVSAMRGGEGTLIDGLDKQRFIDEMTNRGYRSLGMAGEALGDPLQDALKGTGRVRSAVGQATEYLADKGYNNLSGAVDVAGRGVARVGETWGKWNDFMLGKGAAMEDAFRLTAAADYLSKNAPDFAKMSAEGQAQALDQAARFGREALVDVSQKTPFERAISDTLIPFYSWSRGTTGRTLQLAAERPQALANTERILNSMFTPLSPEEKQVSDAWIQEQGPVKAGWLGDLIGNGGPEQMMLTGRYLPQGSVEQMLSRPTDYLVSNTSPLPKTIYELLANRSTFKNRDIDRLAGGFPGNVVNPLIGRPYEMAGQTLFGYEPSAAWMNLLQNSPVGRYAQTASEAGRSLGFWSDPYKAETSVGAGAAWVGTGGKVMPFDFAKYANRRQNEQSKRIRDLQYLTKLAMTKGDVEGASHYRKLLMQAMNPGQGYLEGS